MKIDNRILYKFSQYITNQIYAITLIIQQVMTMEPKNIEISGHKTKFTHLNLELEYYYLKMSFFLQSFHYKPFLQHFLLNNTQ